MPDAAAHRLAWHSKDASPYRPVLRPLAPSPPLTLSPSLPGGPWPSDGTGASLGDLHQADPTRQRRAQRRRGSITQQVLDPQGHWVYTKRLSQLVHLHLGSEDALGCAEASEGPARRIVGIDAVHVNCDIWKLVGTCASDRRVAQNLVGGVAVGTTISDDTNLGGDQLPFPAGAPFTVEPHWMTLTMSSDRFLAAPDDLNRTSQTEGGQCQDNLHRHILAPTKGATDGRVDDANLLRGYIQCVRDLLLVLPRPLSGHHHCDPTLVVDVGQTRLRLQIGVLLSRGSILAFHNDVRCLPPGIHVALADLVMADEIAHRA